MNVEKYYDMLIDRFYETHEFPNEITEWDDEELSYFLARVRTRLRESEARYWSLKKLNYQATRNDI